MTRVICFRREGAKALSRIPRENIEKGVDLPSFSVNGLFLLPRHTGRVHYMDVFDRVFACILLVSAVRS